MSCSGCGSGSTPSGCGNNGYCASGGCSKLEVYDWLSDIQYDTFTKYDTFEISFKNGSRKGFYKLDKPLDIVTGDFVIVESSVGYDLGKVSLSGELVNLQMRKKRINTKTYEFRKILRIAKQHELDLLDDVRKKEKETMLKARILARNLGLDMKLGAVEYQADGKKATFYYFADGRVDFRELIKVLAKEFSIKIEMRQIGARQEAGIVGGIGSCGRELCCSTWLTSFKSVNTTAARYQNLSINQTKLSGQCGRLKCCLNYELDTYLDALKAVPKKADKLYLKDGIANLVKTDVLKGEMLYYYDNQYYNLSLESATTIVTMNSNKQQPHNLKDLAIVAEAKIEEENFVDLVGQISINSLDKNDKKKKKRKNYRNKRSNSNNRKDKK
ncbi:MAG: regulatory iron-sulfur-containing complex subunit RicT [Chitinophagales bacterium]